MNNIFTIYKIYFDQTFYSLYALLCFLTRLIHCSLIFITCSIAIFKYILTFIRDAPFDIWGGGGLEFLLLANFFLPPVENKLFLAINVRQLFFMLCWRNVLSYAFPIMYITIWCFFWSTYFLSISTANFFLLLTFSTNFFFLTFVATNYFFQF